MKWTPQGEELTIEFDPKELDRYRRNDPDGVYHEVRWPRQLGKSRHGEFPLVVAREHFRCQGFTVWASEPELPHDGGFVLVSYPGKRRAPHAAYTRMIAFFGEATVRRLNSATDRLKAKQSKTGAEAILTCLCFVAKSGSSLK